MSVKSAPLLVELFTEELPPKALLRLGEAFRDLIASGLVRAQLMVDRVQRPPRVLATPRRLAALFPEVLEKSADRTELRKLMPSKVAFGPDGAPTVALTKRLEKEGASVDQIERKLEGNAEQVFLNQVLPGVRLVPWLQQVLEEAIVKLPIPKVMSYQLPNSTETVKFVRPAHGLVALHGTDIINITVLGLTAGRVTHGHRFLGARDIQLKSADEYEARLKAEGKVVASFEERRAEIDKQLKTKATELGCSLGDYETLLDEVTALVEWPVVYMAGFEPEFLSVPQECLILTMRTNQKYFPLFDKSGRLTEKFLVVSNMQIADPKNIIEGNQRVVRPRLADARFFYEQDRKVRLESRVPQLGKVVYHNKLGSQLERVERIQLLAGKIARLIGTDPLLVEHTQRAAWLAKADLLTGMVGEFPELQGIMGRYYAQHDGEPAIVADAIAEHYLPRFASDRLPESTVACCVALADKLYTLAGLFSIGQTPTGDKDPFGLRRAALGVIRILVEKQMSASLHDLVNAAFEPFAGKAQIDLQNFFIERMRGYFQEQGYTANEVEAILSKNPVQANSILKQLEAVRAFSTLPEAASLAAANKRIANILRQAESKGETLKVNADISVLKEPIEIALFEALQVAIRSAKPLFDSRDFTGYLKTFAPLKSPVDSFFDKVMVMVEENKLRENRLALLGDLRDAMNRFADISKLAA